MRNPRILLAGPCGVGKSAIGDLVQKRFPGLPHLELDRLRILPDGISVAPGCSLKDLHLETCLAPRVPAPPAGFVLDIGGDTVFRRSADNDERLEQVHGFKRNHDVEVVMIHASETVVRQRFLSCKSRQPDEFEGPWHSWLEIGAPYWQRCADRVVDTSAMDISDPQDVLRVLALVLGQ